MTARAGLILASYAVAVLLLAYGACVMFDRALAYELDSRAPESGQVVPVLTDGDYVVQVAR